MVCHMKCTKKCAGLRTYLWRLLKVVWRKVLKVPTIWNKAEGGYIPREEESTNLGQFRMATFLLDNGLINISVPSVQKTGVPGFQGVWSIVV